MKKNLITGVVFAVSTMTCQTLFAQDDIYLGGHLGYMFWDDERTAQNDEEDALMGGGQVGYRFAEKYAVELSAATSITDMDAELYQLSGYYFFGDQADFIPYLVGGLSYSDPHKASYANDSAKSVHLGVGLSRFIQEQLELRGDVRAFQSLSTEENFGPDLDSLSDVALTLAFNYYPWRESTAAPEPAQPAASTAAPEAAPEPAYRTMTVELSVNFNTDSDVVISYGYEAEQIARAMQEYPELQLTLEGHTDSRASEEYNQDLSQRRAETVKAKMVNDYGIAASRIRAVGYGESRPIATNETAAGRAQNRRVVGVISWQELVD